MCRGEMRWVVVSRAGVWKGLCGGLILWFMTEVMLVCVRVWGVDVRLMAMGMRSTCVPRQCQRSSFARGGNE
jgi:hypothetical protein